MCTVSFISTQTGFIITSNRDEQLVRPTASPPEIVHLNGKKILFPKDEKAGGTWFAADEFGNVIVLLNGAFEKHLSIGNYRKSRGLILLDIIGAESPYLAWQNANLKGIEPFTIILVTNEQLFQLRWDSREKNTHQLSFQENHIWSSVTLYDHAAIVAREKWFYQFLASNRQPNSEDMQYFHKNTRADDPENGLIINRNDIHKTFSITQAVFDLTKGIHFIHEDLLANKSWYNLLKIKELTYEPI